MEYALFITVVSCAVGFTTVLKLRSRKRFRPRCSFNQTKGDSKYNTLVLYLA